MRAIVLFSLALALPAWGRVAHEGKAAGTGPQREVAEVQSTGAAEAVIHVEAKKFEFTPRVIELRRGVPVVLEFVSLDRKHGVKLPELGLDLEVSPDKPTRVRVVPDKEGTFDYQCSVFCGSGHEEMGGRIVVKP